MDVNMRPGSAVRLLGALTILLLLPFTGTASPGIASEPPEDITNDGFVHRVFLPLVAFQAPGEGLFGPVVTPWVQGQPKSPVIRSRQVEVNLDLLGEPAAPASRVHLNLSVDTVFDAVFERTETNRLGSFAWVGRLEGVPYGRAMLVETNGLLFGKISMPGTIYEIRHLAGGRHVIEQIDQSAFPPELNPILARAPDQAAAGAAAKTADACDEILVLVAYSPEARAADGGTANIEARIATAVVETNDSYINSGLVQRVHLAGTMETTAGDAQNEFEPDLAALKDLTDGIFDDVDAAREFHFADQVALIIENDDYCGLGYLNSDATSAFVTVHRTCATGYFSFAHELGHNSGALHDWYVDDTDSYAHGWVYLPDRWRTIMAYNDLCKDADPGDYCTRLQYWSNPNIAYDGTAMGVPNGTSRACTEGSTTPDPSSCDADTRTKLNATCSTVANFRSGNQPPQVTVDDGSVSVDEGYVAENTGTVSDPDGHDVELTASVGDVVNNGNGTWSWSFVTDDGPAESQSVTIYADDGHLETDDVSFELTVDNVAPEATFNTPDEVDEGHVFDLSLTGAHDPSAADSVAGFLYAFDCGYGYGAWSASSSASCQTYDNGVLDVKAKIKDKDDGETEYGATVTVNNLPPEVTIDIDTQTLQYSDQLCPVLITATDVMSDPLMASAILPDSLALANLDCALDGIWRTCTWRLEGTLDEPEGNYVVTIDVDDDDGGSSSVDTTINVEPEGSDIWLEDGNPVDVGVDPPGGDSLPFTLTAYVQETQPDVATCGADPGDINDAQVEITLVPVGPGSPVTELCSSAAVTGSGYEAVLTAECAFDNVPANAYHVQATVVGGYYVSGLAEDVLVIFDPSLGFTTGGGWVTWPGSTDKTNLSFNVKYQRDKAVHGQLLLMRHTADGALYELKAKGLFGLAIGEFDAGDATVGWASFIGKAAYMEPGWASPLDDCTFVMYVEDWNEPGKGHDQVWLEVQDPDGVVIAAMSMALPAVDNAEMLGGGNVVVPHQGIE
jgi:hypothetical protein